MPSALNSLLFSIFNEIDNEVGVPQRRLADGQAYAVKALFALPKGQEVKPPYEGLGPCPVAGGQGRVDPFSTAGSDSLRALACGLLRPLRLGSAVLSCT